jgi:hypothetical protein
MDHFDGDSAAPRRVSGPSKKPRPPARPPTPCRAAAGPSRRPFTPQRAHPVGHLAARIVGACCPARRRAVSVKVGRWLRALLTICYSECMDALKQIRDYEFASLFGNLGISMYCWD